jgi:hypothetical protein
VALAHSRRDIVADNARALRGVTQASLAAQREERLRRRAEWCDAVWERGTTGTGGAMGAGSSRPVSACVAEKCLFFGCVCIPCFF